MLKEVIIFPTDTVYGIGASIKDEISINKIYEIKGREFTKPLAVLCANLKQVESIAVIDNRSKKLAEAFWPGALTLILKTSDEYKKISNEETIGIRIPNHPLALELLEKYGPLKTTSVNKTHEEPLNDYNLIKGRYSNIVNKIYENNMTLSKVSSTIVDLTNEEIKVLRKGDISLSLITNILK